MSPAFKKLESEEIVPIGYQRVNCHMSFDVNIEDFRLKAKLVVGGHVKYITSTITYAGVVSREKARIDVTLAALNDLLVKLAEIQNAYITAPVTEKIWTVLGQEFGEDAGRKYIVVWSLYGLKSAGAAFRNHLSDCMHHLGFLPCTSDLDIWMKQMVSDNPTMNSSFNRISMNIEI